MPPGAGEGNGKLEEDKERTQGVRQARKTSEQRRGLWTF